MNDQADGCAGGFTFKNPGKYLYFILFTALRGMAGLAGLAAFQVFLQICFRNCQTGRAAINNTAQ